MRFEAFVNQIFFSLFLLLLIFLYSGIIFFLPTSHSNGRKMEEEIKNIADMIFLSSLSISVLLRIKLFFSSSSLVARFSTYCSTTRPCDSIVWRGGAYKYISICISDSAPHTACTNRNWLETSEPKYVRINQTDDWPLAGSNSNSRINGTNFCLEIKKKNCVLNLWSKRATDNGAALNGPNVYICRADILPLICEPIEKKFCSASCSQQSSINGLSTIELNRVFICRWCLRWKWKKKITNKREKKIWIKTPHKMYSKKSNFTRRESTFGRQRKVCRCHPSDDIKTFFNRINYKSGQTNGFSVVYSECESDFRFWN